MRSPLLPEDRLCLVLARGHLSGSAREAALQLLAGPLQWDLILERAKSHAVYPLLYRNLRDLGCPGVPDPVHAELEALFRMNALHNSLFAQELARVLGTLHSGGIPVIPLKGLFLAESLYGDIHLRVSVDMDILVLRQHAAHAFDLLAADGYEPDCPRWFVSGHRLRNNFECTLRRREGSVPYPLELHWGWLLESATDDGSMRELWDEAYVKKFLGVPVFVLNPEGQLLLLAAHAARHNWQGLKWLVDIHELCLRRDLAWDRVAALSRRLGWEELLRWSVSACHALLDTPLPPDFALELPPGRSKLFPAPTTLPASFEPTLLYLRLAKRPSEKLRVFLRRLLVPTPVDHEVFHLPSSLLFLYYLIRPFRLGYVLAGGLLGAVLRRWTRRSASGVLP